MTVHQLEPERPDAVAASALYVYGIVRAGTTGAMEARGIGAADVVAVGHEDLAALVSRVRLPVRAKRRELLAHAEVLNEAIASGPVLPLRFGAILRDERAVAHELLEPRRAELRDLLTQLETRVELTVRAFYRPEAILAEIVRTNPRIARLREATRGRPETATHALRLELGSAVAAELEARGRSDAAAILDELRPLVADLRVDDTPVEHQLLRASLLVERRGVLAVDAALDAIARRHADRIDFKYVGPLAPHSFVSLSALGEELGPEEPWGS